MQIYFQECSLIFFKILNFFDSNLFAFVQRMENLLLYKSINIFREQSYEKKSINEKRHTTVHLLQ